MTISTPRIRISTPTEPVAPGRGFYQLEDDLLYVQIGPFSVSRRFYSYLESDTVCFTFDKTGRMNFIEVSLPRRRWKVDENLSVPDRAEAADIRWLDFRESINPPTILTNRNQTAIKLTFSENTFNRVCYLGQHVFLGIDNNSAPAVIWVDDIADDLAGQEISAYRKKNRSEPMLQPQLLESH